MSRVMIHELKTQIQDEVKDIMDSQFPPREKWRQLSDLVIQAHINGIELKKDPRGRR